MPSVKSYNSVPSEPGCYLFKDKNDVVIYVGKAKVLKKRVASYFTKKDHDPKTNLLVKHIDHIDFFITKNEKEALLLENNLIKKYYPKYNIDLKDSRRYAYLRLSDDDFPILEIARTRDEKGQYFGPFTSGRYRRELVKLLSRTFRILSSKPSGLRLKSLDKVEYKQRVKQAAKILKGDVNKTIKDLLDKMHDAAGKTHYEYARILKNQIDALMILKEKQNVELRRSYDADILNFIIKDGKVYLLLFNIYKGILENKQEFEFPDSPDFLNEFLLQYYSLNPVPKSLILPIEIDPALSNFLESQRRRSLEIIVPQRGTKKALLDLAKKNVEIALFGELTRTYDLMQALDLPSQPEIIECFDISHLRGTDTVASMVVFKKGRPLKSNYRRFKIQTLTNGDDYAAMREVVYRRYTKSLKDSLPMPDLIVIDGGAGQLSSALKILKEIKLDIPVISLAKRLEEIYIPGKPAPLLLAQNRPAILLLRALRDEAHRFAISYNRFLRNKHITKKN